MKSAEMLYSGLARLTRAFSPPTIAMSTQSPKKKFNQCNLTSFREVVYHADIDKSSHNIPFPLCSRTMYKLLGRMGATCLWSQRDKALSRASTVRGLSTLCRISCDILLYNTRKGREIYNFSYMWDHVTACLSLFLTKDSFFLKRASHIERMWSMVIWQRQMKWLYWAMGVKMIVTRGPS